MIIKNHQRINFNKLKVFDSLDDETEINHFYNIVIEEIFLSNPDALELLKNLSVLNTELKTNIDIKLYERSFERQSFESNFNELLNTGMIKKKKGNKEFYEFSFYDIQEALERITDKKVHEKAVIYYERKKDKYSDTIYDKIEVLFHKAKLNPTEELVEKFLTTVNNIEQFDNRYKRLINIGETLMVLDDKYKAPILMALGGIFSAIGRSKDAERILLNALDIYKKLAKKYYKIYLPYVTATQKNLGTLYIDLKRFEDAEKIYLDSLKAYEKIERQYYRKHSLDLDLKENEDLEKSYLDDLKSYNDLLKQYYGIYLPQKTSKTDYPGDMSIDLDLLNDIKDGSIDSLDSYRTLAKISYDMYLINIAKTQSSLGIIYSELMKFEEAEKIHLEALKIKRKVAEKYPSQVLPELALSLIDLGDLYASLNKFEDAEQMFLEGLKISKQLAEQNPEVYLFNVAIIQNCLGTVYTRLQKYKEAEQKYLEALKIFKKFANDNPSTYAYNVVDVQNNLGNLFLLVRNLEKAEYYLRKALKANLPNGDILYNIACLESLKNNQKYALELLVKVIEFDRKYIERIIVDERFDNIRDLQEFKDLIGE